MKKLPTNYKSQTRANVQRDSNKNRDRSYAQESHYYGDPMRAAEINQARANRLH